MAPLPPFIARLVSVYLTQALTRRLSQSPAFFRLVDRLVHEADHFPNRLQGRPVPPYISRDPQEPTLTEQAQEAWRRQVDDVGEPHDMPDPYATHARGAALKSQEQRLKDDLLQRQRALASFRDAQLHAKRSREQAKEEAEEAERHRGMDEMRALLDKLRDQNKP